MNRTLTIFLLLLSLSNFSFSQNVAINATGALPNSSAILDISSSNKGLLIPRVSLIGTTDAVTIAAPATSLLVYNTATVLDVTPGYYYWNGTSWVRLLIGQNNDWTTSGNNGTTAGTNFIGTSDAVDFVTKTNNLERMRITSAGLTGINTSSPLAYLHIVTQPGTGALRLENSVSVGIFFKNQTAPVNSKNWSITNAGSLLAFGAVNDAESGVYNPFVIHRNGFVGINTASPSVRLEARGATPKIFSAVQIISRQTSDDGVDPLTLNQGITGNATATSRYGFIDVDDGGIKRNLVLMPTGGNVGIGTVNPAGQLELSLDQGLKPGTNTWTITSDERLKIIHSTYNKGLNEILRLNPITYSYKNEGSRIFTANVLDSKYAGFSAQEVQKIFPEAVSQNVDGYLNFNIHPILIAYTNAIKELDEKNKALEERIIRLENVIKKLTEESH